MARMTRTGALFGMAISMALGAPAANAQQQSLFIQAPGGGDCVRLGGTWAGKTCTLFSLNVRQNQTLTVRRGATAYVQTQFVNTGHVIIRSNFLVGKNIGTGGFVNYGYMEINPEPGLTGAPGLHVHFFGTNNGVINNKGRFGNYNRMQNGGQIGNYGDLYNGLKGEIRMSGRGLLNQSGTLRNKGVIVGRVLGPCSGKCFNRALSRRN